MLTLLRSLLVALGAGCIAIGTSIMALGAEVVGSLAEHSFNAITGITGSSPPWPPTMDSELRFYAALFVAFGLLCLRTARNPQQHGADVPWLMLVFFSGGVGRAASWAMVGAPHPFFLLLMWIELVLPVVVVGVWWTSVAASAPKA